MFWTVVRILVALGAALTIYWIGAAIVRMFATSPPPDEGSGRLEPVHIRFECTVCGSEVTMTMAPDGEVPTAPRHCMEEMHLVADAGSE